MSSTRTESRIKGPGLARRRRVAFALIEGPHTIFPRGRQGTELDPTLHFTFGSFPKDTCSVILFCDNTVNRHHKFHDPVVRVAVWKRRREVDNTNPWPLVTVRWGRLRKGRRRVAALARRVAEELGHAPVIVDGGIFTRNGAPKARVGDGSDEFQVMLRTRLQKVTLRTPALVGDSLHRVVHQGCRLLQNLMSPLDFRGWKECYDQDLSSNGRRIDRHWRWDGNVKATGA